MFVGHLGVGLALKSIEPKINVGVLVFTSLLLDVLLGIFVLFGIEQVIVPENYSQLHYLNFSFPYSHSLIAAVLWTLIVWGAAYLLVPKNHFSNLKASAVIAASVLFHWVCDYLEHPPQLPLTGNESIMLGLGLWNKLEIALAVEILLVIVGVTVYIITAKQVSNKAKLGMVALMCIVSAVAVIGQLTVTQAPGQVAVAISMIVQALVISALAAWIDLPSSLSDLKEIGHKSI
ncbi:MAG: hypothetical protein R8K20_07525 [Gallionellaceae bacterium]